MQVVTSQQNNSSYFELHYFELTLFIHLSVEFVNNNKIYRVETISKQFSKIFQR